MMDLSKAVQIHLDLYAAERRAVPNPSKLEGPTPPEIPIEPGTTVAMTMEHYHDRGTSARLRSENPWVGSGTCVVGVVAGINYGRSNDEQRNHYRVAWCHETWNLTQPDGEEVNIIVSSLGGMPGWPHPWHHDLLTAMRGLPA